MNLWQRVRRRLEAHPVHHLDPRAGYDRWAPQYAAEDNPVLDLESRALQTWLPEAEGKRVLDAGCGAGRIARLLAPRRARSVIGVDFSANMLRAARRHLAAPPGIKFVAANLLALPFAGESFEMVTAGLVMGHLENLAGAVGELARVSCAGGTLLISDFHPFGQLLGWNRSFLECHNGKREEFCIRNYLHLHEDYFRAFKKNGLRVEDLCEPRLDESVKNFFDRTRKGREVYERFYGFPVVLIFKLTKR